MSANYKEKSLTITGTSYVRANRVVVENGLTSKSITFQEEELTLMNSGETSSKGAGSLSEPFTVDNASTEIQLMDPTTGLEIPNAKMKYEELYTGLYSLYMKLAKERDEFEAAQLAAAQAALAGSGDPAA